MEEKTYTSGELIAKLTEKKEKEFQEAKALLSNKNHKDSADHMTCFSFLRKLIQEIEEGKF